MKFKQAIVLGAGAVGSYLGARLAMPTTLVARENHVRAIMGNGLRISGREDALVRIEARTTCSEIPAGSLVLVGVKLGDLEEAAKQLEPLLQEDTVVAVLANGLDPDRMLAEFLGRPVHRVIVQLGVTMAEPGIISSWGGKLLLGPGAVEDDLAAAFEAAGFIVNRCEDLRETAWKKFILNCVVNPLSALTGCRNRELITELLAPLRRQVVAEILPLAKAAKVSLPEDLSDRIDAIMIRSNNRTSMLQDVLRGRSTEIEFLNGWVVRRAAELGLDAPVNAALAELVRLRESSGRRPLDV